jgi:hypothetical protein
MASRCYHGIHYLLSIDVERPGLLSEARYWWTWTGLFVAGVFVVGVLEEDWRSLRGL